MIKVTDDKYLTQIKDDVRNQFYAEVKMYFTTGVRTYTTDDIISIEDEQTAHLIAGELPTQETAITLLNLNGEFSPNDTSGYYDDISNGIVVEFRFGFYIDDTLPYTYWFPWQKRYTSEALSMKGLQVTINCTDYLALMSEEIPESYTKPLFGDTLSSAVNLSSYPKRKDGSLDLEYAPDIQTYRREQKPTILDPLEIVQSIAYATCNQLYLEEDGTIHVDNLRKNAQPEQYTISVDERFEESSETREKSVKQININYYVDPDATIKAKVLSETINAIGEELNISNQFITRNSTGTKVMSNIKSYLKNRNICECSFRADPRLQILDRVKLELIDGKDEIYVVDGTLTSIKNKFEGDLITEATVAYEIPTRDNETLTLSGATDFVFPAESDKPVEETVTLICTTNKPTPTYKWEYYNSLTSQWTLINNNTNTLSIHYTDNSLIGEEYTTFKCTVGDRSVSVNIRKYYVRINNYTYLGKMEDFPK